jgi:hypothetical protein
MKRLLIILSVFISLTNCKQKSTNTETLKNVELSKEKQFRNVNWDMTKEEVVKNENKKQNLFIRDTTSILYDNINMFGKDFSLNYTFDSLKLKNAIYFIELKPTDNIEELYESFKSSLISKYGRPATDQVDWKNSNTTNSSQKNGWYLGILMNELSIVSAWKDTITVPNRLISIDISNVEGKVMFKNLNTEIDFYKKLRREKQNQTQQNL